MSSILIFSCEAHFDLSLAPASSLEDSAARDAECARLAPAICSGAPWRKSTQHRYAWFDFHLRDGKNNTTKSRPSKKVKLCKTGKRPLNIRAFRVDNMFRISIGLLHTSPELSKAQYKAQRSGQSVVKSSGLGRVFQHLQLFNGSNPKMLVVQSFAKTSQKLGETTRWSNKAPYRNLNGKTVVPATKASTNHTSQAVVFGWQNWQKKQTTQAWAPPSKPWIEAQPQEVEKTLKLSVQDNGKGTEEIDVIIHIYIYIHRYIYMSSYTCCDHYNVEQFSSWMILYAFICNVNHISSEPLLVLSLYYLYKSLYTKWHSIYASYSK